MRLWKLAYTGFFTTKNKFFTTKDTKGTKKSNIKPFVFFVSFVVIFHGQGDRSEPAEQATGDAEAPGARAG